MYNGHICVAGIERGTLRHVRPVLRANGIPAGMLALNGGPFAVGAVVDLGDVIPCGRAPEVEDCYFALDDVRKVGDVSGADLWSMLARAALDDLQAIFGDMLAPPPGMPRSLATPEGQGRASLGVWRPAGGLSVELSDGGRLRLGTTVAGVSKSFAITDTRLYQPDMTTPDSIAVATLRQRLGSADEVLVCVGLGRAWAPEDADLPRMHWMQVNGVHCRPKQLPSAAGDSSLMRALRKWRFQGATDKGRASYCFVSTAALEAIATERPTTLSALSAIRGVGERPVAHHGEAILEIERQYS